MDAVFFHGDGKVLKEIDKSLKELKTQNDKGSKMAARVYAMLLNERISALMNLKPGNDTAVGIRFIYAYNIGECLSLDLLWGNRCKRLFGFIKTICSVIKNIHAFLIGFNIQT